MIYFSYWKTNKNLIILFIYDVFLLCPSQIVTSIPTWHTESSAIQFINLISRDSFKIFSNLRTKINTQTFQELIHENCDDKTKSVGQWKHLSTGGFLFIIFLTWCYRREPLLRLTLRLNKHLSGFIWFDLALVISLMNSLVEIVWL